MKVGITIVTDRITGDDDPVLSVALELLGRNREEVEVENPEEGVFKGRTVIRAKKKEWKP